MIKCANCGNVISDGFIIKSVSVIEINYQKGLVNCKCRKCKTWNERLPINKLIRTDLVQLHIKEK